MSNTRDPLFKIGDIVEDEHLSFKWKIIKCLYENAIYVYRCVDIDSGKLMYEIPEKHLSLVDAKD